MKHKYAFLLFISLLACGEEDQQPEISKQIVYRFGQEPESGNCESGGVAISQGKDLNDNGVLDTDEVMSVSYVCNDEVIDGGKTFVLISGRITNEEAAARLAKDIGPNTEVIRIQNTKGLSHLVVNSPTNLAELSILETNGLDTLVINGLKQASEVSVFGNLGMNVLSLPDLEKVDNKLEVIANGSLTSLKISSLHTAYGSAKFQSTAVEVLDLSGLEYVDMLEISNFTPRLKEVILGKVKEGYVFVNVSSLKSLDVSQITHAPLLNLAVYAPFSLDLDLSNLVSIHGLDLEVKSVNLTSLEVVNPDNNYSWSIATPQLKLNNSPFIGLKNLVTVFGELWISESLSSLEQVYGQLYVKFNRDGSISFPKLQYCTQLYIEEDPTASISTVSIEFPELDSTYSTSVSFTSLTKLSFPSIEKLGGEGYLLEIFANENFEDISFSTSVQIEEGSYRFVQNALGTDMINDLLALLANVKPELKLSNIALGNQTPPAPPSGQGINDLKKLRDNGNTVTVD